MILIDYVFIVIFAMFAINTKTRVSACVLVVGYMFYWMFAFDFIGIHRYGYIALINTASGSYLLLVKKDYPIAILFYLAVFVGFLGGILYANYYPAYYYDNMCITIMTLQALTLLYRVILNGLRDSKLHTLHGYLSNDRGKGYNKMRQGKKEKETY